METLVSNGLGLFVGDIADIGEFVGNEWKSVEESEVMGLRDLKWNVWEMRKNGENGREVMNVRNDRESLILVEIIEILGNDRIWNY